MENVKRAQLLFLLRFIAALAVLYLLVAVRPVNDHVVVPFTAFITRVSAGLLHTAGERAVVAGTVIRSSRFAVDVENGCNGIEAVLLLVSAMLAFPARGIARLMGALAGFLMLEVINVFRVASLFWLGEHHRTVFEMFHAAVWQTAIVLVAVGIFFFWSRGVVAARARDHSR
jgi:exosortase H (IPTLxxWG-CTERM-specific)